MPKTKLDTLKRKRVEIRANGFYYRGILIEATDEEITLRTDTGFVSIPMDRIVSVKDPTAKVGQMPTQFVDSSFYDADLVDPNSPEKKD